ncbi:SAG-related sequence SRS23 [Besnoitia besnoiti]|uniref:SAG-related sequence SRS23 n=1 Tax=Besnoitia besnoiti TaxID=94643 RepID=A0A2A9MAN5_BESBE|nr:SAG-related sequence SRS23 [Besnoitia besnoiti]PFH32996.1 SAG-related sequence SRS23 [Besnoitia besnoiti]
MQEAQIASVPRGCSRRVFSFFCFFTALWCFPSCLAKEGPEESAAVQKAHSCTADGDVTLVFQPEDTQKLFECPGGWELEPSGTGSAFQDGDEKRDLGVIFKGAGLQQSGSVYTLSLPAGGNREKTTWYYNCKKSSAESNGLDSPNLDSNGALDTENDEQASDSSSVSSTTTQATITSASQTPQPTSLPDTADTGVTLANASQQIQTSAGDRGEVDTEAVNGPEAPPSLVHVNGSGSRSHRGARQKARTSCRITIEVIASTLLECKAGETKTATVSAAGDRVAFKCAEGLSLRPDASDQVYDDQDEQCSSQVALTSLVNGSLLSLTAKSDPEVKPVSHVLRVNVLPAEQQALCYRCVGSSNAGRGSERTAETAQDCVIKVSVSSAGSALSGVSGTSLCSSAFVLLAVVSFF